MTDLIEVQHFIDLAARSRDGGELEALLDETTRRLGFNYFALVHHVDLRRRGTDSVIALWTYPAAWVDEYLERRLATNDPVHLASHRTNVGFSWDRLPRLITLTPAHDRVRERTRRAGIGDGFTVPANIPGEANGSCSFAMEVGRALPEPALPAAQLVGAFAFHAARRIVHRRFRAEPPRPKLSPRQTECLILMGRGATDRQAAQSLGLAEDTVTEYLNDARRRYGVPRRTTLILRAIFDGQIALSDVLSADPPLGGKRSASPRDPFAPPSTEASMTTLINRYNVDRHAHTLRSMHAARKQVFVDLLGWNIPHDGIEERDEFDDEDAVYLVVTDPESDAHLASVRLLRTDRPHILGSLFPQLCSVAPPTGPDVREITRFCLAPGIGRRARMIARAQLVRGFVEYALLSGIRAYTGVAQLAWLTQILAAGWDVRPLGLPQIVGGQLLGALEIRITSQTIHQLTSDWNCEPAAMRVVEFALPLAA